MQQSSVTDVALDVPRRNYLGYVYTASNITLQEEGSEVTCFPYTLDGDFQMKRPSQHTCPGSDSEGIERIDGETLKI